MRWRYALILTLLTGPLVRADDLWDRRDPQMANMFNDYRARRVGDLLTIVIDDIHLEESEPAVE